MKNNLIIFSFLLLSQIGYAQLLVSRDTITVIQNDTVLKMPWANGLNFSNVSNIDLNLDGKNDIVMFDRVNSNAVGHYRCFMNTGVILGGQTTYSANPDLSYYFPTTTNWAVFRDYNCDGKEDLFCSTPAGIKIYKNTSTLSSLTFSLVTPLLYSNFESNQALPPIPANLYAASNAVPGIVDIDGDGDLDILTFSPGGYQVEYHKNLSKENNWNCDSLKFEIVTACWGNIEENQCQIALNQSCVTPRPPTGNNSQPNNRTLHAGSCLTCLDSDGDGDQDLIMGDVSCNIAQFVYNGGSIITANMTDTTKLYPNYPNKGNTLRIQLDNFPCSYHVDVDGDNKNDLVVTPNIPGSENVQCVWYYKNTSATNTVNFQFVKKNLFTDEMIEVGENSFPVLFDYNADGYKDLLIGNYGYYNSGTFQTQLTLYKNTGTNTQPSFSLVTRDYAGVLSQSINCASPTVGDIDGDGDIDILISTQSGQVHWLKNTAGVGAPATFTFINNPFSLAVSPPSIAAPAAAAAQLFDIDLDGLLDLMIGGKNGHIWYYRNVGTLTSPSFSFITNNFGNVNVQGPPALYPPDGYASPFFYMEGGAIKLLVGSVTGQVQYFSVPSASVNCNLINAYVNGYNEGAQSVPFFEDINGDGKPDLFLGNGSGGLSFFSSKGPDVGIKELTEDKTNFINVFPNPAQQIINVSVDKIEVETGKVSLSNILGKEIYVKNMDSNIETIDVSDLRPGIYFIKITINNHSQTVSVVKKIIKE